MWKPYVGILLFYLPDKVLWVTFVFYFKANYFKNNKQWQQYSLIQISMQKY
jgi:hypothetical protein